jgi:Flp pilus assembly pilin Flp
LITKALNFLRRNDLGQDLAEYCLITAVIALIGLGLFVHASGGLQNLWGTASTTITAASASTGAATGSPVQSGSQQ